MTEYRVTLGVSVRAYRTITIEADGLLDLMDKAKGEIEGCCEQFPDGDMPEWEPEASTITGETLCWAAINDDDVIENVDLTQPERFEEIARELEAEKENG